MPPSKPIFKGAGLGAAFLMATSAIGPGFLTQTTVFTQQLLSSFGFVIFITIVIDIGAQLNIWRIVVVSGRQAQTLANELLPGVGHVLSALVVLGGLAFNIGNIGGAGLGLHVVTGINASLGSMLSCLVALAIFWWRNAGQAIDMVTRWLGLLMILLTLYVAIHAAPPMAQAVAHTFWPQQWSTMAIVTIVGGTVGGYISFAGAHRLLDAGLNGPADIPQVNRSAVSGILITAGMRYMLFLAALGIIAGGAVIDAGNPPAAVFGAAAGNLGYRFFGVVMWCASITSVIGSAYTSISFVRSVHPAVNQNHRLLTTAFIIISTAILVWIGKPVKILVIVGALNGLILPVSLVVLLIAANRRRLMGTYRHPLWMQLAGWLVVLIMGWLSVQTIWNFVR